MQDVRGVIVEKEQEKELSRIIKSKQLKQFPKLN
jgi:hypothetical protein